MAPKFGTSGLRGLVVELTEDLVRSYVRAFLSACPTGQAVYVGWDLRPSSPQIAGWVLTTVEEAGLTAMDCGPVPTPALALAAGNAGAAAVMITGSHIPADRNGLKFYTPAGEISKTHEADILAALDRPAAPGRQGTRLTQDVAAPYVARYKTAFGTALSGVRIGVYQHSSVARDLMIDICAALGATAIPIARSDTFIPVDTEALDPQTQALFAGWFAEHDLDVLISTDGDADRPMVVDDARRVVPGDVLGALSARMLDAAILCTPVSSNTQVESGFGKVCRTRIGSPFVIAAMEEALLQDPKAKVVGYEANGGFLLGFTAEGPDGPLPPLLTRDCMLPIIAPLVAAGKAGLSLSAAVDALPPRFTAADRIQGIAPDRARAFLAKMTADAARRADFFAGLGTQTEVNTLDGLRVRFDNGQIVHLRPSGNAPEFRCYAEAGTREAAQALVQHYLGKLHTELHTEPH